MYESEIFRENLLKVARKQPFNLTSQKAIAKRVGIPESTISKWFRGTATPGTHDLVSIAETFGCSIDYLLGIEVQKGELCRRDVIRSILQLVNTGNVFVTPDEMNIDGEYKTNETLIQMYDPCVTAFFDKYNNLRMAKLPNNLLNEVVSSLLRNEEYDEPFKSEIKGI